MSALLALGWGALVVVALRALALRVTTVMRARVLQPGRTRRRRLPRLRIGRWPAVRSVRAVVASPLRARRRRRAADVFAGQVAVAVDLVGVGVAAGCTPYLAVELASEWAPPPVARECDEIVRACALGQSFDDALRTGGLRVPALRGLTDTLRTSARLGSPAAPALARLASEVRAELRRRAEARARTVPVRLCFPLVGCILPAFALLTVVPVVLDGLHR